MSSEASIDSHGTVRLKPGPTPDALQPWQLFTLAGLIGATAVVYISRGQTPAGIVLLSLTVFAAAVVGLAVWRTFAPFTSADQSAPQMLGGRTRAALEREKTLVLRSIKELEFDHAMRKVSDKDFAEMGARLRLRAARLIRQLDAAATYREQIEQEIAKRVKPQTPVPKSQDIPNPTSQACVACGTVNDVDARFCKQCGATL